MAQVRLTDIVDELYSPKPPETLSHYTSLDSFAAICQSKSMFASDIRFLNDAQELHYFGSVFKRVLKTLEVTGEADVVRNSLAVWIDGALIERRMTAVFALSLSEHHDQLSQWRAYTKLRSAVSIGFCTASLSELAEEHHYLIGKCLYEDGEMEAVCFRLVEIMVEHALNFGQGDSKLWSIPYGEALSMMVEPVLQIAALFKSPAFKEEGEWRIVSKAYPTIRPKEISFRAGKEFIIPFKKFPLKGQSFLGPVNQLIVGPSSDGELSIRSMFLMLQFNQMLAAKCATLMSTVPLR